MVRFFRKKGVGLYDFMDMTGEIVCVENAAQHLQYMPFGELFVSQMAGSFDSRYKFSAKELDNETNYSYFGARYYTSEESIWLSVDPMSDKYPHQSAYMYCNGNPIMLFDPNGLEGWPVTRQWNNSDISGFASYSAIKLQEFKTQKIKDDCANFALRLIVGYASENGLPLTLINSSGETFNASTDKYQNTTQYLNDVRAGIQAQDLPLNTYNVNQTETQAGDMTVIYYSINEGNQVDFNHVVIFLSSNKITWGNLMSDGSGAELHNSTNNWTRSPSYNDGVTNKFNIYSGLYNSRWNVLNPSNMRDNTPYEKMPMIKTKEINNYHDE